MGKDSSIQWTQHTWNPWFIEEADTWRPEAWQIIKSTPHLTYQILTKRPERIKDNLPPDWGLGYENVWLGVSVENQEMADLRIPILSKIPASVRFLSVEPLIGPVNLSSHLSYAMASASGGGKFVRTIDWVIVGGESGNDQGKYRYRPCEISWIENVVYQCETAWRTPVFVKQLGTHLAKQMMLTDRHGGDIDEFPVQLQVRQFPKQWQSNKVAV